MIDWQDKTSHQIWDSHFATSQVASSTLDSLMETRLRMPPVEVIDVLVQQLLSLKQRWLGHNEAETRPDAAAETDRAAAEWRQIQRLNASTSWNTSTTTLHAIRDRMITNQGPSTRWLGRPEVDDAATAGDDQRRNDAP